MTITYEILMGEGLKRVEGEPVVIKNALGMTFGVHRNRFRIDGDDKLYVVSNIESGMLAGNGASSKEAISCARKRIRNAVRRSAMAKIFEAGMRTREAVVAGRGVQNREGDA
ncbi:hypothetical protein WJ96_01455 [Burkholderia ubonensis]|uniref:Uncharacterized protein n=1 Tax=Burkholderia ubonensis TaxID=101571 RepID=A0AAW3MME6_9BURK|nr:hypothetical protein [Burkholderia ubonensis]KVP87660.1 hypothetical protein WJ96_01455 [Burkholderia ubonensis]